MTYFGVCEACGEPVQTTGADRFSSDRQPAFPVTGWEVPRAQGGTNHVRNRERVPNRVRHVACLPADDAGQERLL